MKPSVFDRLDPSCKVGSLGSMNVDHSFAVKSFPKPGETVRALEAEVLPGGKSSNQIVQASLLGMEAEIFGVVGKDAAGSFLLEKLRKAGVGTGSVRRSDSPSGSAFIMVAEDGENEIAVSPGCNSEASEGYVGEIEGELQALKALGLCLESPIGGVLKALEVEGPLKVANLSPIPEGKEELAKAAQRADVAIVNGMEAEAAFGRSLPKSPDGFLWGKVARELKKRAFPAVLVTLGSRGSVVLEEGSAFPVGAKKVEAVDCTGCGDAFAGSVMAALASGMGLREAAELASFASAFCALGRGAQASYGSLEKIRKFAGL